MKHTPGFFLFLLLCLLFQLPFEEAQAELKIKHFGFTSGRVVFTYFKSPTEKGDLYVLDFEALTITPVHSSPGADLYPTWSMDGKKIAFSSDLSGNEEIYLMNADGSGVTKLTNSTGKDEAPNFSPSGSQLAFHGDNGTGGAKNIFTINADGTNARKITNTKKQNTFPRWSPRENELLFTTSDYWPGNDIMLFDLKTSKGKLLTNGFQSFNSPTWSPDGASFIFSYGHEKEFDLWIQEKGGKPRELTTMPGRELDASWSDDEQKVFFVAESEVDKGDFQLFLLDLNTQAVTQVTEGDGFLRYPSWNSLPPPPPIPKELVEVNTPEKTSPVDKKPVVVPKRSQTNTRRK